MNAAMVKNSEVKKFRKSPRLDVISSYNRYDAEKIEEKFGVNNKIPYYRPTFKTLDLNKLEVAEYQRELSKNDVKEYIKDFNWYLVGVLLVSYRNGKFYIVDGQHRKLLLEMIGAQKVMCQVVEGLTYEEEAELFKLFNTKKRKLGREDILIADLEMQDVGKLDMLDIVSDCGYCFKRTDVKYGLKDKIIILAEGATEDAYYSLSRRTFKFIFELICDTWPRNPKAVQKGVISGLAYLLKRFSTEEINRGHFIKTFAPLQPSFIVTKGREESMAYSASNSDTPRATAEIIMKYYNQKTPKGVAKLQLDKFYS